MSNTILIARKEFSDLVRSNVMVIVFAVYCALLLYSYYDSYRIITATLSTFGTTFSNNPAYSPGGLTNVLCCYGSLVAIVLGLSSMYDEIHNHALNVLALKPVYRDTILNGKLLGVLLFALLLYVFTILVDMSLNFIFWGEHFRDVFPAFVEQLPLVLIVYLLIFLMFYLSTVLVFLLFGSSGLAFFVAFIAWMFIYEIIPSAFSLCASQFFPDSDRMAGVISSLSPQRMLFLIFINATDTVGTISANASEFIRLALYVTILLVSCYVAFLRRDIS